MKQIILHQASKKPIILNLPEADAKEVMECKHYLESIVDEEVTGKRS